MPVAGDGDSSHSYPSSSSSFFSDLQFFVRTSSRTLTLRGSSNETIKDVIFRVAAITHIPLNWLHLHNGKRRLPLDWTLSRCGIENDSSLQLVYGLEVKRICVPWKVANDLIILIDDFSVRSHISSTKEAQIYCSIDTLIKKFVQMTPTGDNNDTIMHIQVFFDSGVHVALRKLYHSPLILHQNVADYAVRLFLKYSFRKLPGTYHFHYAPVLLNFCKLFNGVREKRDSLYLHCRKTLAFLVNSNGWRAFRKPKLVNFIMEFYPYVVELAEQIIVSLSSESMSLPITDVAQFSCFLNALRWEIKDAGRAYPIPKEMHLENWVTCLYEIFIKLLKHIDESLEKIENFMIQNADMQDVSQLRQWTDILTLLSHCRKLGKIYEDGGELLHGILLCRRMPLNALIRRALRNEKYHWLLKHKDLTDFETRRSLAMMLFAESSYAFYEPHEILIERSQLLTESFLYIDQVDAHTLHRGLSVEFVNEEATGHGVLREWFCLVCQAIFNPQNELFSPCPNDRRRFFPKSGEHKYL